MTTESSNHKIILHLSTVCTGGAGFYAIDFHNQFLKAGYESYLMVKEKLQSTNQKNIFHYQDSKFRNFAGKFRRKLFRFLSDKCKFADKYFFYNKYERFTCVSAHAILKQVSIVPDIIFVHWVSGFINAETLHELANITQAKIYILLIDNAPLTGGCHYPWDCRGFQKQCNGCPAVKSILLKKTPEKNLLFKQKYLPQSSTILAGSETDYRRVKTSTLFKSMTCTKMYAFIDENLFKPSEDLPQLKEYFHLPANQKVLFFGSTYLNEERKGMRILLEALALIDRKNFVILLAGKADIGTLPFETIRVGYLNQEDLIKAYQVADIFVCPSLEDSGPIMINQSMMTGTPVVAFETGVALDLVQTGVTGYSAKLSDSADLAKGINYLLNLDQDTMSMIKENCRKLAIEKYGSKITDKKLHQLIN